MQIRTWIFTINSSINGPNHQAYVCEHEDSRYNLEYDPGRIDHVKRAAEHD